MAGIGRLMRRGEVHNVEEEVDYHDIGTRPVGNGLSPAIRMVTQTKLVQDIARMIEIMSRPTRPIKTGDFFFFLFDTWSPATLVIPNFCAFLFNLFVVFVPGEGGEQHEQGHLHPLPLVSVDGHIVHPVPS